MAIPPYPNPTRDPRAVRTCDNPRHGLGCQCLRIKQKSKELKKEKKVKEKKKKEGKAGKKEGK
jgi:hypothetical protein